jgi:hypothetical protein
VEWPTIPPFNCLRCPIRHIRWHINVSAAIQTSICRLIVQFDTNASLILPFIEISQDIQSDSERDPQADRSSGSIEIGFDLRRRLVPFRTLK